MHLDNIWIFLYFAVNRSGHFEKRSLADKLPQNEKSTLTVVRFSTMVVFTVQTSVAIIILTVRPLDKALLQ